MTTEEIIRGHRGKLLTGLMHQYLYWETCEQDRLIAEATGNLRCQLGMAALQEMIELQMGEQVEKIRTDEQRLAKVIKWKEQQVAVQ
jgi:hypothetical protein